MSGKPLHTSLLQKHTESHDKELEKKNATGTATDPFFWVFFLIIDQSCDYFLDSFVTGLAYEILL